MFLCDSLAATISTIDYHFKHHSTRAIQQLMVSERSPIQLLAEVDSNEVAAVNDSVSEWRERVSAHSIRVCILLFRM